MAKKANATTATATPEKPKLSAQQKRELFLAYDQTCRDLEAYDAKRDALVKVQRECVGAIAEHVGKGPFSWQGKILTAIIRDGVWFFRGPKEHAVEKI